VLGLSSVRRGLSLHLPFMLGYGAFMFVFALVLQQGLHTDPLTAGLATMPMAVPFLIASLYLPAWSPGSAHATSPRWEERPSP
jgi:hypothetical protein